MDFYKRMGIVCHAIPEGQVASYGQIALLCGKPRGARQVGYGLRCNLAGRVPAHRVVNSKGELSGAQYFLTGEGQKMLLEQEGVQVRWNGRCWAVALAGCAWRVSEAEAAALQEQFREAGI